MNRLTKRTIEGTAFLDGEQCGDLDCFDCIEMLTRRLASYEDTGLTPSGITDLHNYTCQLCGKYKTEHLGSCNKCRWKKSE